MNFNFLNIPKRLREGEATRKKIEKAIQAQTDMIADCEIEKKRYKTDVKRFCQIWSAQKEHEANIKLLKDLLC